MTPISSGSPESSGMTRSREMRSVVRLYRRHPGSPNQEPLDWMRGRGYSWAASSGDTIPNSSSGDTIPNCLVVIRSIFSTCNALCQGGLLTLLDVPPSVCYPSGRRWQRRGPKPGEQHQTLLRQWLKAGFLEKHAWFATMEGTPQGGTIVPFSGYFRRWTRAFTLWREGVCTCLYLSSLSQSSR